MHRSNLPILDLHGLTWGEAEASLIEHYKQILSQAGKSAVGIDVVHRYRSSGTGGVLLTRLTAFLSKYESCVYFQPGEKVGGNPGHTMVVPQKPLLSLRDQLSEDIWNICDRSRYLKKIIGNFLRHGVDTVLSTFKKIEKPKYYFNITRALTNFITPCETLLTSNVHA